jgi:hypothetical protein
LLTDLVEISVRQQQSNGLKTRRNMNMKNVTVTNQQLKAEMAFAELLFGSGKEPSFTGKLLAVNPTKEDFATYNENFAEAVADGFIQEEVIDGVVYYDTGADRAYLVDADHVEITTLQ